MTLLPPSLVLLIAFACCLASAAPASRTTHRLGSTSPILRRVPRSMNKRQKSAAIGLGDIRDVEYSVQITIGSTAVPVILDTGSSDLWSISTECTASSCGSSADTPKISASSLKASGVGVELDYGDSTHPTFAAGMIYSGPASVAGLQLTDQFLVAVNATTTDLTDQNISGIFGVGFPSSSQVISELLTQSLRNSSSFNGGSAAITNAFIDALSTQGPLISRLVTSGQLTEPMFTVTLQRETVEVGGNVGQLTIGQLPDGVSNDSLTWVPVRLYTEDQGGLAGPTSSPNELYPVRWEVPIDDVLLNGQTLPKPTLNGSIGYTALIDSGTSFLAGPKSVVSSIYSSIASSSSSFLSDSTPISCTTPVKLTYVIGGKPFPVDPRDFLGQQTDTTDCTAGMLLPTDAPTSGNLMSWILGDPFMKSNLVAFYYGNLTHPSVDPPRMGFLSTVPSNADDLYGAAIQSATRDGDFALTSVTAPTGTFAAVATDAAGVAQAPSGTSAAAASGSGSPSSSRTGSSPSRGNTNGVSQLGIPWTLIITMAFGVWAW